MFSLFSFVISTEESNSGGEHSDPRRADNSGSGPQDKGELFAPQGQRTKTKTGARGLGRQEKEHGRGGRDIYRGGRGETQGLFPPKGGTGVAHRKMAVYKGKRGNPS